jgi:small subunit ribosomal protein S1
MVTEWIPGDEPPDEAYWQALLRDDVSGKLPLEKDEVQKVGYDFDALATKDSTASDSVWREACRLMEEEQILDLPVIGYNRGGVLVGWNGLRGFVPASHLVDLAISEGESKRLKDLEHLVGERLSLKIIELDPDQNRFVLSERATSHDENQRQALLDQIFPGDVRQGRVTNLCSFGAFVDLGGLEGLIHVSELSWGRVGQPRDVLERGQQVEVYVINVDRGRGRVGLSLKRLQPDPWQFVDERYQVGQIVGGVITHVVDFGAFARVEEGLEGLIHVSELSDNDCHPCEVVQVGDAVNALIINIDGERRRMGLSLKKSS